MERWLQRFQDFLNRPAGPIGHQAARSGLTPTTSPPASSSVASWPLSNTTGQPVKGSTSTSVKVKLPCNNSPRFFWTGPSTVVCGIEWVTATPSTPLTPFSHLQVTTNGLQSQSPTTISGEPCVNSSMPRSSQDSTSTLVEPTKMNSSNGSGNGRQNVLAPTQWRFVRLPEFHLIGCRTQIIASMILS